MRVAAFLVAKQDVQAWGYTTGNISSDNASCICVPACPGGSSTTGTGEDVGNGCKCNNSGLAYWGGTCNRSCSSLLPLYVGSPKFANRVDQVGSGHGGGYCSEVSGLSGYQAGCRAWGYGNASLYSDNASCICQ